MKTEFDNTENEEFNKADVSKSVYLNDCFKKIKKCIDSCVTIEQLDKITPFAIKIYYQAKEIGLDADLCNLILLKGKLIIYKANVSSISKTVC